jgi:hypothetical protein
MNVSLEMHVATTAMVDNAMIPNTTKATVAIVSVGLYSGNCPDISPLLSADVAEFVFWDSVGENVGFTEPGTSVGARCVVPAGMRGVA